jgi:uncharacterized repeat protein (TIGR01451 family)
MALVTVLLLFALLLGLERLTVQAKKQISAAEFDIFKTVSHESATQGMSVTFTIDVYNVGDEAGSIDGTDVLPQEMDAPLIVMADSAMTPTVEANTLEFAIRNLSPGQGARLVYRTWIKPEAECGQELVNHAQLMVNNDPIGEPAEARLRVICSDLGDAPASDNHFLVPMNLPDGTQARYPTVYNPPMGAPSGPLHRRADLMHLGEMVSFERQADIGPDTDLVNNILPPFDAPDLDGYDDGLLNWDSLNFVHCEPATLEFLVFIDPALASNLDRAFINVWFDGNRDGDWADINHCDNPGMTHVPEHIVIDYAVPSVAGFQTVTVNTTFPVFNARPDEPGWLRVTLSEQPSVKIGVVDSWMFGDGRGVFSTMVDPETGEEIAGFMFGETEDYFFRPQMPPEPGPVIVKSVTPNQAAFGDTLRFQIQVSNTLPYTRLVTLIDPIPDGTSYVNGSAGGDLPGASGYDAGHNAVYWRGEMAPYQVLTYWFSVRVVRCDPYGFVVLNRAWAFAPGSLVSKARAMAYIADCVDVPPRRIRVRKWASPDAIPGGKVEFTLAAHSAELQTSLVVVDPLHFGLEVNPDTLPPSVEFYPPNLILWQTDIVPNEVMSVTFTANVRGWACREGDIFNQAYWWSEIGLDGHSNPTWTNLICSDLGDAPDSTFNHHGVTNTAYSLAGTVVVTPLVPGLYPTVRDTTFTPGEPNGPFHRNATAAWLGKGASFEVEADTGPDADGLNNILAFGLDNSDNDGWDDGWLNRHTPLPDCREATLKVRVTKNSAAVSEMWLNVWFDGNRDGDWEDWKFCGNDQQRMAFEWIVPNYLVDMSTWPVGAQHDITVHTFLVMNDRPHKPAWMRFTLSERQPPRNPATGLADGRGPGYWYPYRWGETEDYQAPGMPEGEPGEVSLDKTASDASVGLGQVYTYSVYLSHSGGSGPAFVVMTDVLPAEVKLAGGPTVVEVNPSAVPLVAYFDSSVGPNGAVGWHGLLSPDAAIRVDFPVKVRHCPTNDTRVIINEAVAKLMDGTSIPPASTETHVDCDPPPPPDIELHKSIVTDLGELVNEWHTVPGEHVVYKLVLENTSQFTYTVQINDPMPSGVIAIAADATSGAAHIIQGGRAVVWRGEIGPANTPVIVRIRAKLREVHCDAVVRNQAFWFTPFFPAEGESNVVWLRLRCHDLGDAPDSSNHFNTMMTTYPSVVTATFPTVYTGTTPLLPHGPLHLRPRPLHLGPRVSFEMEADLGMDLDGVNNIKPQLNKADLDRADDGVELHKLHFVHCEYTRIPIWISIHPSVLPPTGQERLAYINVWLDGFRDGDWDDATECPTADNQWIMAPEHIVIDHAVNLTALGPGLHRIYVTTTGPVPRPLDLTGPAWMRVTLSERESNKTLPAGCGAAAACTYGDGRGYADPFELGETEDYLLRGPDAPDPAIEKHGFIHPWFNFDQERRMWYVGWPVHYGNIGGAASTNVQVIDTLEGNQELARVWSHPYISPTINGSTLTFDVGTLRPGKMGHIFVHTTVPFTATPGTVLTNTVVISSGNNDADLTNNSQVVTLTIPLLPPWIAFPRPGTTCSGMFTITGRVQLPGATVEVFIDHTSVASVTADAMGRWFHPVNLTDGTYSIQARAIYDGNTSPLSPPVKVIVDSSLVWSPLSLRFISEHGHVVIPKDENGRTDEDGWFVFLRPGVTYTVTVYSCCDDPNTSITLELPGVEVVLQDDDGDGWFEATFTMPEATLLLPGSTIRLCVVCYNVEYCSDGEILIDPEGVVYDVTQGQESLLSDVQVACYEGQTDLDSGETTYGLWDAESYGGQVNPQTTASDGYFSFFTPAGVFQLDVYTDTYQSYRSWDLVVVDEPVEFNVPLTPDIAETADYVITVDDTGFLSPVLKVEAGAVIEWVNVGDEIHTTTSVTPSARIEGLGLLAPTYTDGWDSGLLSSGESYKRQLNTVGSYYYHDHENTAYTGLIVVEGESLLYLPLVLKLQ